MFGRLAVQGLKLGGRPATSWVDCLQKNLEAFGAIPRKDRGRKKWVAFGVVVKDGRDWVTAAKNVGMWHRGSRGERKHSITPGDARTFANNPNLTCGASARLVNLYSSYVCDFVLFCPVALIVSICLLPAIEVNRYGSCSCFIFGQLTPHDASCVCIPYYFISLIVVSFSSICVFISVCCIRYPYPCLPAWVVFRCL